MLHRLSTCARHSLIPTITLRMTSLSVIASLLFVAILPVSTHALSSASATTNQDKTVQASEVASALAKTDGVLSASDQTRTTSDSDSAIKAATAGTTVDIPKDASDGVSIGATDGSKPVIDISLPNASSAKDATTVAPGTVAYAGNNGSAEAVQATEDGGVRMLTVIDNPNAPTSYDYKVTVPNGGHIELATDGSALILDNTGQVLAGVASPWAKDAKGTPIQTYFTTDGQTLTQHVLHNVKGVVYPVTADPWWNPLTWFRGFTWKAGGKFLAKKIGPWGWVFCVSGGSWAWYRSDAQGWVRVGDAVSGCVL